MKTVCLMPCRNEDWILGLSARAALMWCDEIVLLNHASTDGTKEIIQQITNEVGIRLSYIDWKNPVWEEMRHRQCLLDIARGRGATHIVMVDADEVLSGNWLKWLQAAILNQEAGTILQLPWLSLRGSINRYQSSGLWAEQWVSTAFVDRPEYHWQAQGEEKYDFHHRHPMGPQMAPYRPIKRLADGGLMHLQFVSDRRLRAKQALYKMQEVIRWPSRKPVAEVDRMYSLAVYGAPTSGEKRPLPDWAPKEAVLQRDRIAASQTTRDTFADVPASWWAPYDHLMQYLHVDAEPWQEAECVKLMKEHGPRTFEGLDLFGVV